MEVMHQQKGWYKRRFVAMVRWVLANAQWLLEGIASDKTKLTSDEKPKRKMTVEHRAILNKNPLDRTEEERLLLQKIISGLRGFNRFSDPFKLFITEFTTFAYYEPGKYIIRKGNTPMAMYFLMDGICELTEMESHDLNKKSIILKPGSLFGAKSLLHKVPRGASVSSVTSVQLLVLHKKFFVGHYKDLINREWLEMEQVVNKISYFRGWDATGITQFCLMGRIKLIEKDTTVIGDGCGSPNMVYFLLSGKCQVIEELLVDTRLVNGVKTYELYKGQDESESDIKINRRDLPKSSTSTIALDEFFKLESISLPKSVEKHFMQVIVYSELACFGVGENMHRRRIVALTDVKILSIPRYWLYESGDPNIWFRIRRYLDKNIPTTDMVFRSFIDQKKWKQYSRELTSSFLHKQPCNTVHNIPYTIRINHDIDFYQK